MLWIVSLTLALVEQQRGAIYHSHAWPRNLLWMLDFSCRYDIKEAIENNTGSPLAWANIIHTTLYFIQYMKKSQRNKYMLLKSKLLESFSEQVKMTNSFKITSKNTLSLIRIGGRKHIENQSFLSVDIILFGKCIFSYYFIISVILNEISEISVY